MLYQIILNNETLSLKHVPCLVLAAHIVIID